LLLQVPLDFLGLLDQWGHLEKMVFQEQLSVD
jgi:hypothetical protein